ncbi:MAG: PilZ domain-containing protein, partial [Methylobacteriaceae bacterium]|nr:PilZ domain-containing protein [Methylobacteriaceae bacterium]
MSAQHARVPRAQSKPAERRRFQRVAVTLLGRYMLVDRREFPCQTVDMSPGGVLLVAPVRGEIGDRVIAYLEHVGRVEGIIRRHVPQGFAMSISATAHKRDKLASQLTWLANRQVLGLPEDRRHERITPRNQAVVVKLENGREFPAILVDISMSGAALSTDHRPPLDSAVLLGSTPGKVVRHFGHGIA